MFGHHFPFYGQVDHPSLDAKIAVIGFWRPRLASAWAESLE